MTAHLAAVGALAHGVHWTIVLGGSAGMVALALPSMLDRRVPGPTGPRDEHERRVHELRGRLRVTAPTAPVATPYFPPTVVATRPSVPLTRAARLTLPVALVASAAAAGVHAAVGPAHLADQPLVGWFFLACAAAQLAWSGLALLGTTPALLLAGVAGNVGLLALWVLSRTAGLAGSGPEPVGAWDLAAVAWQLVAVVAAGQLLRGDPLRSRAAGWWDWEPVARRWLAGSVLALAVLSLSGVAA